MDGFFVAKFRITKRAKQAKEEGEVENAISTEEDVGLQDIQFDEKEDEGYIQGKSTPASVYRSSGLGLTGRAEAKRRRLKAKGLRVPPRNQP